MRKYNQSSLIQYLNKLKIDKNQDKKILIDVLGDPEPWHVFHNIQLYKVMNKMGYSLDFYIGNNQNYLEKIYGIFANKFIKVNKLVKILQFFPKIIYMNFKYIKNYCNIDKLFHLRINNVYVGDLIYDDYLRRNYVVNLKKPTLKYFIKINEAFFYYLFYNEFLDKKYEYVFINHISYVRSGLLGRLAEEKGIKVVLPTSSENGLYIRKHFPYPRIYDFWSMINPIIFNKLIKYDKIVKTSYDYFENVMNQNIVTYEKNNFNIAKSTNTNNSEINRILKDKKNGKKIVLIASHALIDAICGSNGEHQVYKDMYLWLTNTIEYCLKNKNIITYIKIHPREYAFKYSPKVKNIVDDMKQKELRVWPDDLDLKKNTDLIDAVFTVRGSVALEYPSFGVPCIMASKANAGASGFDTVIECDDEDEYKKIIEDVHLLEKLDDNEIKKARLLYYLFYNTNIYLLDDKYMPNMESFLLDKYKSMDSILTPKHDKYKDEVYCIIKEKLELFDEEIYEQYILDIKKLFSNDEYIKLADIQFIDKYKELF